MLEAALTHQQRELPLEGESGARTRKFGGGGGLGRTLWGFECELGR